MKNFLNKGIVCLLIAVPMLFTSCKKDDDNNEEGETISNSFTYNNTTYDFNSGVVVNYGEIDANVYNFDVELLTTTIENNMPADDVYTSVYFELFTGNATKPAVGTYTLSNSGAAFTFDIAEIYMNYDYMADEGDIADFTSGTLEIMSNGTYELEFTGITSDNLPVTGYYKGTLTALDFSGEGKGATAKKHIFLK